MSLVAKRMIYELEDESEKQQIKMIQSKSNIINRKLGLVSYIKWGVLYNYHFSFDIQKGRLLCYKTSTSKTPNNYYQLINGQFVDDLEEIQKKEQAYKKKKNYMPPSQGNQIVYVKTKKERYFRLTINQNENYDKIVGYLQMCFSSKNTATVNAFFAMLGMGIIKVGQSGYKLMIGILVPLDNWKCQGNQGYLNEDQDDELKVNENPENKKLQFIAGNIPIIGGIISAFQKNNLNLGLIFNPLSQTIDVILFDQQKQPKQLLYQLFKLVKKVKSKQPKNGKLLKLNTQIQVQDENSDLMKVGENREVRIYCRKKHLDLLDVTQIELNMLTSEMSEEELQDQEGQDERPFINQALDFYKKNTQNPQRLSSFGVDQTIVDDTREFIIVSFYKQFESVDQIMKQNQQQPDEERSKFSVINEEINLQERIFIQKARTINIQMKSQRIGNMLKSENIGNKTNRSQINQYDIRPSQSAFVSPQTTPIIQSDNHQYFNQFEEQKMIQQIQENKDQIQVNQQENQEICIIQNQNQQIEEDDEDDDDEADLSNENPYEVFHITGKQNILKFSLDFKFLTLKDEYRIPSSHKNGGTICQDKKVVELSRSVGKSMIKEIGRKIISGDFNLTTVSFPIKAMIPKSSLERTFMQTLLFPLYINRAAQLDDLVERMKLVMVATISNFIQANAFLKPLNPIIGETFEGSYDDGTMLYCEQTSHHPPVSYFLIYGPDNFYRCYGYSLYEAKASLNSLIVHNKGKRIIEFKNQKITYNFVSEQFSGTFMGTLKHESFGTITYIDEKNDMKATITIGKTKKKPTDYLEGEIIYQNKKVSKMFGSYLGFLEFDGIRYWDAREILPFKMKILKSQLNSDFSKRTDLQMMLKGDLKEAQIQKDYLEQVQRTDAKLRKNFEKEKVKQEKLEKKKKK